MRIDYHDGLLLASLTLTHHGKTKTIDRMVIDTGAAHTIIVSDAVDDIGIAFEISDPINRSQGIGGTEYAFEKTVDILEFGGFKMFHKPLDFGQIDWDINGLIGLDILLHGRFVMDLDAMEIYQKGV
ncbi:MAG: retropepsin-like domain-containing protein [Alicyclobacillus herbarius]|uniref:retropepsin-like aspartic protease n=1 Tax=Alicyclobacillus herbarius TaxID=122960 RepID=UPI002353D4A1|nr:retropepsin-like aspartic protease [Alicyclobacillus herbarius]MCL6633741.1 retropepsin-like domain-containing protein [Alicyclobacillus herbarius]